MPQILSYSYEEIFAEKLRALAERARPRDLYDVVHLYQERHRLTDIEKLLESLQGKCAFKKMPMPNLVTIEQHPQKSEFLSEWKNMLHHQVKDLIHLSVFLRQDRPFGYQAKQRQNRHPLLASRFDRGCPPRRIEVSMNRETIILFYFSAQPPIEQ